MSALSGRRAGLAILSVELEEINADRPLIRVKTVNDVVGGGMAEERSFTTSASTLEYLRDWLEAWAQGP
jgi:hypothetical protein